jgi:hypothetical protein
MMPINARPSAPCTKNPSRYLQIDGAGMVSDTDKGAFVALSTIDLYIARGDNDVDEAVLLSDRIVMMTNGRAAAIGNPQG